MTAHETAPDYARLYVFLGVHSRPWTPQYGRWLRQPYAVLRCPAGCQHTARGAEAVTDLVTRQTDIEHPIEGAS
ncbi:hypothetical protein [Streptomyces niveus]|uniref:hypothetical protein n=1 Tax=Streptomyces niveus TaxID=193462 RepID=UPI0036D39638